MRRRRWLVLTALFMAVSFVAGGVAFSANPFVDIADNNHAGNIDLIYNAGITTGCDGTHYCPNNPVTRAQMATFLARGLGLGKNLPRANGRSDTQVYCAMATANPKAFPNPPCTGSFYALVYGQAGSYVDAAIGPDGFPMISYFDSSSTDLRFIHCHNSACTGGFDANGFTSPDVVGQYTSIAIRPNGLAAISFYDATNKNLMLADCQTLDCGGSTTTLDQTGDVGSHSSIAIGTDGFPIISYFDATNSDLKVAHCNTSDCAGIAPDFTAVDQTNSVGSYTSIAIGTDGMPVISYFDPSNFDLKVAHCTTLSCSAAQITAVDSVGGIGFFTSIAIGTDGMPVVSYYDADHAFLKVAHCSAITCAGTATISVVDGSGTVSGVTTSIAIAADGFPMISYREGSSRTPVLLAHCTTIDCSGTAVITSFDGSNTATSGDYSAVALGVDGIPIIAYRCQCSTSSVLKIARPPVT
jgi:predicted regulator of Ras-like GTPase activity (Roadblock/LC7/MglB family)